MKIDVIVPSRGNPLRLMSVLTCFDALSSGENDVTYHVVCDTDDGLTYRATIGLPKHIKIKVRQGYGGVAGRINEAGIADNLEEGCADAITTAGDDTFPLAQDWDSIIAAGIDQGIPAFSWLEVRDPTNTTNIVWSRKWINAVGRLLPTYFPFWFGDTWNAEVYELAFKGPMPIVENLPWGGKRGATRGMRELAFWFDFFAATRREREEEARALCFAYGVPYDPPAEMLADMQRRDREQRERVPQYEKLFGANQGEASERYIKMKETAIAWLADNGETVHG